jgi:hypothetical protein
MTELVPGETFRIESLNQRSGDLGDLYHPIEKYTRVFQPGLFEELH